jgi:hypothetical protein
MKKEDIKIEIIEQTFANNETKFTPIVYMELRKCTYFENFCNKLFGTNLFQIERRYYELYGAGGLFPISERDLGGASFTNIEQAFNYANDKIDTYLSKCCSNKLVDTKIHKIN